MKESTLGSGAKIKEYVTRIKNGESKDSIVQGLPPSFIKSIESELNPPVVEDEVFASAVEIPPQYTGLDSDTVDFIWTVPIYVDPEKTKSENLRKQKVLELIREKENRESETRKTEINDQIKLHEVRERLGIVKPEDVLPEHAKPEEVSSGHKDILSMIKYVTQGKKQAVIDLYESFMKNIDKPDSRTALASGLFQNVYSKYRSAEYQSDPQEEKTWESSLRSTNIGLNNKKPEWLYRGNFPKDGQESLSRGSFNVRVTPELVSALDNLILSGKINANYKFGQPGTPASPNERHDSISIYFLEEPKQEALDEISKLIKPYVRGDNLLGRKISEGFYISEIGSIESKHIDEFVENLKLKDSALAEAVRRYTAPQPGRGNSLKMSEAQYYAIRDVARAFGYNISYEKSQGFKIE